MYIIYYIFSFISCSICFGPPCAHLQQLTTLWYFFTCGVVPWLCRWSDPVGWLCVHWGVRSTTVVYVIPNGHTTSQTDLTAYTAIALHHTRQKYHKVVSC